ncbi:hypothetical protein V8D89_007474 [Ganoderma adspersum]
MVNVYRQTPFDELESWFATFKKEKVIGSPEEARIIRNMLGKQVIVFDSQNAAEASMKVTRNPTWKADLALAYHTVVLRLSLTEKTWSGEMTQENLFWHHVAAALPHMRNVEELIFLDLDIDPSTAPTKDLFEGTDMPLETLWCKSDALLETSWSSICTGSIATTLQDFRGFCNPHKALPSGTLPPTAPKLKYLETSENLASLLQHGVPWNITHLCIHVEWRRMPPMLRKISNLRALSDRLHSLRLNCYANPSEEEKPPKNGSTPRAPSESSPLAVWTPLLVCGNLRAPVLNFLEIKEIMSCDRVSVNALEDGLVTYHGTGTPSLRRIAWHPAWDEALARKSDREIRNSAKGIFKLALTVDFLAIALDKGSSGPWHVFTRDRRSGHREDAERRHAINELSWKVTEWEDAGGKRWHWPQSSQLYTKGLITL